ncbi:MAG: 1-acyl-sn-glycerol-3-phosphate acyltransferase, partial [Rubripirellula sp.]
MSGLQIFLYAILALVVVGAITAVVSPRLFVRTPFQILLGILYRREIVGLENLPKEGGCVVVSNHISWLDGILILWMLPRNVRFVVDGANFKSRILQYFASAFDTILMMPSPKSIARALKTAREALLASEVVGIFPEGTITRTGQLQTFKPGIQKILKGTEAPIVPMWLEGMWGSIFSFSEGKFFFKRPKNLRRQLTLHIGPAMETDTPLEQIRSCVQKLGADAAIRRRDDYSILAKRIIRTWRRRGRKLQAADSLGT